MKPAAYYNENEPHAAEWLENLIAEGLIPYGYVDRRSIREVAPGDLDGFTQCHFFAGIGGWAHAARLAGWPDNLPLWTGSCPCQPFSSAGKGAGFDDERHLWPDFFRLIDARRPARVFGEQVSSPLGRAWFDGVRSDLENSDYAVRGFAVPACAVNAPHRRERLWFVADAKGEPERKPHNENGPVARERPRHNLSGLGLRHGADASCAMGNPNNTGLERRPEQSARKDDKGAPAQRTSSAFWDQSEWIECADGKRRRLEPGVALLANGLPREVAGMLAGFGNAIVPQVAAELLAAYLETKG